MNRFPVRPDEAYPRHESKSQRAQENLAAARAHPVELPPPGPLYPAIGGEDNGTFLAAYYERRNLASALSIALDRQLSRATYHGWPAAKVTLEQIELLNPLLQRLQWVALVEAFDENRSLKACAQDLGYSEARMARELRKAVKGLIADGHRTAMADDLIELVTHPIFAQEPELSL